jgi:predicted dehydrogenase
MNFCIIGLNWGKNYIKNIEALQQPVSCICSRNKSLLPETLLSYPYVNDYRKVDLNNIDIACICTPPAFHFEIAKYFIQNKKNVIIEKPFVFSVDEATELKLMAIEAGVSVLVAYQYLWHEDFLRCAEQAKLLKGNITIENISSGNVTRPDYSYLWDYSSHDLAMTYFIKRIPAEYTIQHIKTGPEGFAYTLNTGNWNITNSFSYSAGSKARSMHIKSADLSLSFTDNYTYNSLQAMLSSFTGFIEKGTIYTNIDMAIAVTRTLCDLDKQKL